MRESTRRPGVRLEGPPPGPRVPVTVHESHTGAYVFVESGNDRGWIASDLTVDSEP